MIAIYNEIEPFAAAWLRELITENHITDGIVNVTSIVDLQPTDLAGFGRVHLFAGIGGWDLALALAEWPSNRPVWTGSCPCQPFSVAGKKKGKEDARDLWPDMRRLIAACRPEFVFGEQVPGAIGHGWLDRVQAELEAEGYRVGAVVLGAFSVGAPHIRQRLYWVAYRSCSKRGEERTSDIGRTGGGIAAPGGGWQSSDRMADSKHLRTWAGAEGGEGSSGERRDRPAISSPVGRIADNDRIGPPPGNGNLSTSRHGDSVTAGCGDDGIPDSACGGAIAAEQPGRGSVAVEARERLGDPNNSGLSQQCGTVPMESQQPAVELRSGNGIDAWSNSYWHPCRDPRRGIVYRRVPTQPELFPLANGVSNRVGTLRGAGNAIVPQVAAVFIRAVMESLGFTNQRQ